MSQTLEQIALHLNGRVIGDGTRIIHNVNSIDAAQPGDLTFAEDARRLEQAMHSSAGAVIVSSEVKDLGGRSGIGVPNPKLAFALALDLFHPRVPAQGLVHPSAVLGRDVQLDQPIDIRAHAVIGNRVRIGRGTIIEPGTYIGDDVTIGERCLLGPNVVIYHHTIIGQRVSIHGGSVIGGDGFGYVFHDGRYVKVPQVGNVVIEDDVEIGCNSCVDRATVGSTLIQCGTKLDNHVQVAHNNRIGRHVILAGQVGLAGSVTIGDYSMLGGKAGVIDHLTLGQRVQVGAASIVTKDTPTAGILWGYPARPVQRTKEQMASMSRLPALFRTVADVVKRLTQLEERLKR